MMAPLPTTAHVHMTAKKTLYVANPTGQDGEHLWPRPVTCPQWSYQFL